MSAVPTALHAALKRLPHARRLARASSEGPTVRHPVGHPLLRRFAHHRLMGLLMAGAGWMEAKQGARYHEILRRLHLLDRLPASWDPVPLVEALPIEGSRPVEPSPDLPPGIDGPWPQAPVLDPGLYAPVMNLSPEEERSHLEFNVLRYLGQVTATLPKAVWKATSRHRLGELDDATFASLLQDTVYSQYIRSGLDTKDVNAFRHLLKRPASEYFKVDFSLFDDMETIDPSLPQTGSVTLLERDAAGRFWPLAIRLGDSVIEPRHEHAWELAQYFVLQHAGTQIVLVWHPRLHFPCDALHAITLSVLPDGHPIKQLVLPHTPLTLGLHQAVIHNQRSIFHNNQREVFTPFAYTPESIHRATAQGRAGIPGNRGYPAYRWGDDLIGEHVRYGTYRREWADAFFVLCQGVLAGVSPRDRDVSEWADHIASFVPGFPDSSQIFRGDTLARAVATWMRCVTVFHTADHYSFARIPMKWTPLRLRTSLPRPGHVGPLDRQRLVTREDRFRHALAHELFFKETVIYRLHDVRYDVPRGRARSATAKFREDVARLDAKWAGSGFPTSREIGASIHY